jgi:hypothetical protein
MTRSRHVNLAILLLAVLTSAALAQSSKPASSPKTPPPAATMAPQTNSSADSDQQQATRQDLRQMRAILNQMRTNLGFVGSTTTPLNHQFELDIEMWQALLDQMERRMNATGGNQGSKP